jgi:tight adherence protein C
MNPLVWMLPLCFLFVGASVVAAGWLLLRLQGETGLAGGGSGGLVGESHWGADLLARVGRVVPARGQGDSMEKLLRLLFRAGHRVPSAPQVFQGVQVVMAAVLAMAAGALSLRTSEGFGALIPMLCGAGFGYLVPERILEGMVRFRVRRIRAGLPPALDLLVLALEAGQPLEQGMQETAHAVRKIYPELASEFIYCSLEINAGTARGVSLARLGERSGEEELRKVAAVLIDGDRFGTPLGPALRTHAQYLRTRMRQGAQEAARKLTVKLVLPVFFLIFPSVLLVTLGPAYFQMRSFLDGFLN